MTNRSLRTFFTRNAWLVSLALLIVILIINWSFQNNLFELRVLNNNLRTLVPLMILAAGQTIVVLAGGIDLSVGTMVSMLVAVLVNIITPESTVNDMILAVFVASFAGALAGALNGLAIAYFKLQPIVTTYATSFIFGGIALLLLPRPGGAIPRDAMSWYRSTPLEIPLAFFFIGVLILFWLFFRSTRYSQFLYAVGSDAESAYTSGVPVRLIRLTTYVWSGIFAALAASALILSSGSGQANIGDDMTLDSIVAVVLGGTALKGGSGGIIGSIIGVLILRTIRNIIFFAEVPTWSQTLVNALIIIFALAAPGLIRLIRKGVSKWV